MWGTSICQFSQPCIHFQKIIFVSFTRLHNLRAEILPHMNYLHLFNKHLLSGYYVLSVYQIRHREHRQVGSLFS